MDSFALQRTESANSVASISFQDDSNPYYLVGTAITDAQDSEPSKGRILVFNVVENKLKLISEKEVRGAVVALKNFNGKLLAAINSRVKKKTFNFLFFLKKIYQSLNYILGIQVLLL